MSSQEIFGETLQLLQIQIESLQKNAKCKQLTPNQMIVWLQGLIEGLNDSKRSLSELAKIDQEVESKKRIYYHIAEFLQDHFHQSSNKIHFSTYLNTVYLLCQEQDARIVYSQVYSKQAYQLEDIVRRHCLKVEAKYERFQEQKIYRRQLTMTAHKENRPVNQLTSQETEAAIIERRSVVDQFTWRELPASVQQAFVQSRKNYCNVRIYPVHSCNQVCCCGYSLISNS
ncbi:hypothetical protein [Thermocoleostomius sinensis]|uniref:Uncharacterized protein n=1 Tax=Thermocoleostomius sinensis A174 TaxID=2016057 RepID=A0A9E8ZFB5_9CYAN|nr:hypothetical protein [Thermocoleostomius sinensis]WAL60762.1 hypothetical protein OXH18_01825 [Thermocoleostomius sinensis A174]